MTTLANDPTFQMLESIKFNMYCRKFKQQFRDWLWVRVRYPKIVAYYDPTDVALSYYDIDDENMSAEEYLERTYRRHHERNRRCKVAEFLLEQQKQNTYLKNEHVVRNILSFNEY